MGGGVHKLVSSVLGKQDLNALAGVKCIGFSPMLTLGRGIIYVFPNANNTEIYAINTILGLKKLKTGSSLQI